jgi:hypothetical protein
VFSGVLLLVALAFGMFEASRMRRVVLFLVALVLTVFGGSFAETSAKWKIDLAEDAT